MELAQYKSLQEKDDSFQNGSFEISRIIDLNYNLPILANLMKEEVVFRGVNEAKYKLYNSGQRKYLENGLYRHYKSYKEFIIDEIKKFKEENK